MLFDDLFQVFDNYTAPIDINGKSYLLNLVDTAGQEGYERLRSVTYPNTSVFMLCFAVDNRSSFENIESKWVPDIKTKEHPVPILLVGCKSDARLNRAGNINTMGGRILMYSEGTTLARKIGAVAYMECSAKTNDGVNEVFNKAVLVGAGLEKKKRRRCEIM
uniref:Rho-related GTP-binding protein RhoF n=1 Tax=Mesocestoides corti TaxID=53468 RepID=A0A5K3FFP3_MESCO